MKGAMCKLDDCEIQVVKVCICHFIPAIQLDTEYSLCVLSLVAVKLFFLVLRALVVAWC